ncbi:MAG: hypothetical protein ACE14S_12800 [Candidatus Bathyarchaeia archaeon]
MMSVALFPAISSASSFQFFPYITVSPDPIGVGQQMVIIFGFTMPSRPPSYYSGWTLTITKPDGTTQTRGPYTSDSTGGTVAVFNPDAVGKWTFQASYSGGSVNLTGADNFQVPVATTPSYTLTPTKPDSSLAVTSVSNRLLAGTRLWRTQRMGQDCR